MDETIAPVLSLEDPIVVLVTWGLTWACRRYLGDRFPRIRMFLPAIAALIAVFGYALSDAIGHDRFTLDTLGRGLLAAGSVVMTHSQWREFTKLLSKPVEAEPEQPAGEGP